MNTEQFVHRLFAHRRLAIVLLLVLTAGFGAGATLLEETTSVDEFQTESTEAEKLDYIEESFEVEENTTTTQVVMQDENVLDRETMIRALEFQQDLQATETVNSTLADEPMTGVANAVATASIQQDRVEAIEQREQELNETEQELTAALDRIQANDSAGASDEFEQVRANAPVELADDHFEVFEEAATALQTAETESATEDAYERGTQGVLADEYEKLHEMQVELEAGLDPTLDEQREQLESMSDRAVETQVESVLESENEQLLALMPTAYEPGGTQANATTMTVRLDTDGEFVAPDGAPEAIIGAQFEMRAVGSEHPDEYIVFGHGITADEIDSSMQDSMAVVGPLALLFVLSVLVVAYRDPVDIALGLFGIFAVLVWTFGFMGLAGIEFGQIFIAVPVLLIGLSIDYAIHVFMRGREARSDADRDVEGAMLAGLVGVGFALTLVTVTAAVGFLSNVVSPMEPIQQFGIVNAVGITAALVIFGVLVPALKIEIDSALEARGFDRNRRAFGTTGRLESVMQTGEFLARRAPLLVVLVVVVVSAGGVYGGTQVDTSFDTDEFMAEEPPGWTEQLPASMEPGEYTAAGIIDYLDETFLRQEMRSQLLLEGDPTSEQFLQQADEGEMKVANTSTVGSLPNGEPAVRGPLSAMEQVAATNESFNETFAKADTTGDGVPDRNIEGVYDALFEADQEIAADVIHRTEQGEYESARIVTFAGGETTRGDVTDELRAVADAIETDELTATATGEQTVLYHIVEQEILDTVVQSLLLTLLSVMVFLTAISRVTAGSATLGIVTTTPVVLALTWVVGTMYVLGISFNAITGTITSLTIGLGVAYSIHVSQRYHQQLERSQSVWAALRTTVTGTGGALLGSAATTAGGFGVLAASFVPSLQQFGFITAISIIYAFLASVLVLPVLLVIWTRFFGPDWARAEIRRGTEQNDRVAGVADDD